MTKEETSKKKIPPAETRKTAKQETETDTDQLAAEREEHAQQLAEWEDKFLRLAADFDNFKKRTAREFSDVVQHANEELLGQLIPVVDNIERALEAATASDDTSSFYEGVTLIYRQLRDLLERQGVTAINALHEPFDPVFHDAVLVREDAGHPPETVVEEIEKGYLLHGRILRPSKVVVST